jgi:hypothetical protein
VWEQDVAVEKRGDLASPVSAEVGKNANVGDCFGVGWSRVELFRGSVARPTLRIWRDWGLDDATFTDLTNHKKCLILRCLSKSSSILHRSRRRSSNSIDHLELHRKVRQWGGSDLYAGRLFRSRLEDASSVLDSLARVIALEEP